MPRGYYPRPIRPITDRGDGSCIVTLTKGQIALVDASFTKLLASSNWYAVWSADMGGYYARTNQTVFGGGVRRQVAIIMHRLVMGVTDPKVFVDHINHDTLDNRLSNLRLSTVQQNCSNRRISTDTGCTSVYKGVHWCKRSGKWVASIRLNYKLKSLCYFTCEIEAAMSYDAAAAQLFGEFAYLNFPKKVA